MTKTNKILLYVIIVGLIFLIINLCILIFTPSEESEVYPKSLAEVASTESINLGSFIEENELTKLIVYVNYISSSELPQVITNEVKIEEVLDAILNMKVTDYADNFESATTRITYLFENDKQESISFTFQEGLLKVSTGRYYVDNIENLYNIDGINLPEV